MQPAVFYMFYGIEVTENSGNQQKVKPINTTKIHKHDPQFCEHKTSSRPAL